MWLLVYLVHLNSTHHGFIPSSASVGGGGGRRRIWKKCSKRPFLILSLMCAFFNLLWMWLLLIFSNFLWSMITHPLRIYVTLILGIVLLNLRGEYINLPKLFPGFRKIFKVCRGPSWLVPPNFRPVALLSIFCWLSAYHRGFPSPKTRCLFSVAITVSFPRSGYNF